MEKKTKTQRFAAGWLEVSPYPWYGALVTADTFTLGGADGYIFCPEFLLPQIFRFLAEAFGSAWFETGSISVHFVNMVPKKRAKKTNDETHQ